MHLQTEADKAETRSKAETRPTEKKDDEELETPPPRGQVYVDGNGGFQSSIEWG